MKRKTILPFLLAIWLCGCAVSSGAHSTITPKSIKITRSFSTPGSTPGLEEYNMGEPVTFRIEATYPLFCFGLQQQFSIIQIVENDHRYVSLEHSCIGAAGSGVDLYCENGRVVQVLVGSCSDAIHCEEHYSVDYEYVWDQQEYIRITEACEGKTISREIKQQAPAGEYQVLVEDQVVKTFMILPDRP
jgi:hypothetical protein